MGYFARPIGGIVFSHFGDKYGRRRVFIVSILSMSLATIGMGLLPTQASIGTSAAVLMVLLRLIQGFSLGGELPGPSPSSSRLRRAPPDSPPGSSFSA